MTEFDYYGWKNLSGDERPSYALLLRQSTGDEDDRIVKYRGIWMTAKQAWTLKYANGDHHAIDRSPRYDIRPVRPQPPPPPPPPPTFPIMALTFDIREKILEFNATDFVSSRSPSLRIRVYLPGNNGIASTAIRLPPITRAGDRKLRLESMLITIKLVTFEIHSGPGNAKLQKWLATLDLQGSGETALSTGFDAVHSLFFPYFSRFPFGMLGPAAPNNDIELMRRCTNLRKVKVLFSGNTLYDGGGEVKSIDQLRIDYRLDGMLELVNLKFLGLQGYGMADEGSALQPLKKWFEAEFTKRGRPTEVAIEGPYA